MYCQKFNDNDMLIHNIFCKSLFHGLGSASDHSLMFSGFECKIIGVPFYSQLSLLSLSHVIVYFLSIKEYQIPYMF